MKTKITFSFIIALVTLFQAGTTFGGTVLDSDKTSLKKPNSGPGKLESLSGINLVPVNANSTFQLQFTNALAEDGVLELKDASGKTVYTKALNRNENYADQVMNVGRLNSGLYLIEVKSGNTVYWKKVRIRK